MTETMKKALCTRYAHYYQNYLSEFAQNKMCQLKDEAASAGLKFHMTNEAQYMLPHFIGAPRFELVEA